MSEDKNNPYQEGDYKLNPTRTRALLKNAGVATDWVERDAVTRYLSSRHLLHELSKSDQALIDLLVKGIAKLPGREL